MARSAKDVKSARCVWVLELLLGPRIARPKSVYGIHNQLELELLVYLYSCTCTCTCTCMNLYLYLYVLVLVLVCFLYLELCFHLSLSIWLSGSEAAAQASLPPVLTRLSYSSRGVL